VYGDRVRFATSPSSFAICSRPTSDQQGEGEHDDDSVSISALERKRTGNDQPKAFLSSFSACDKTDEKVSTALRGGKQAQITIRQLPPLPANPSPPLLIQPKSPNRPILTPTNRDPPIPAHRNSMNDVPVAQDGLDAGSGSVVPQFEGFVGRTGEEGWGVGGEGEAGDGVLWRDVGPGSVRRSGRREGAIRREKKGKGKKERGKRTNLMASRRPQLEPVRLPSAHASIRSNTHNNLHARPSIRSRRDLIERDRLNTRSILVPLQLRQYLTLRQRDSAHRSTGTTEDSDGGCRVDGEAVDAAVEGETGVVGGEFPDGSAGARVPEDEGRVFRGGEDFLAWR
jgi:hypothetical protein